MEPDVAASFVALNAARDAGAAATVKAVAKVGEAQVALAAAQEALAVANDKYQAVTAWSATLFEQTSGLVRPSAPPPADPHVMPVEALPGWTQKLAEDFGTPAGLGAAKTQLTGKGWAFYDGTPTALKDTSRKGTYDTALTVSIADGVLSSKFTHKSGTPCGSVLLPLGWNGQLYGRFAARFRVPAAAERKIAWMLWPASGNWAEGEVDFPEAGAGGNIWGFNHQVGNPSVNQSWADTKVTTADWHTAVIEWRPDRLTFLLDGKIVNNVTDKAFIPKTPMRWVLQNETSLGSTPVPADSAGLVQIAWVTAHAMTV